MYKLYWAQGSGAMAPQALFEEIGAEYEKIVIDIEKEEHKSDAFLSVNPMGQIPALVLPDGTLMTETAAMLAHIVDRHPEAKLAPPAGGAESARFFRWLFFLSSSVYPTVLRFYYSERHSTDPSAAEGIKAAAGWIWTNNSRSSKTHSIRVRIWPARRSARPTFCFGC